MAIEGFPDVATARAYRRRVLFQRVLFVYWIVCLGVIAVGVDRLHPEYRAKVQLMLMGPTAPISSSQG
jgi:hypothetical protein